MAAAVCLSVAPVQAASVSGSIAAGDVILLTGLDVTFNPGGTETFIGLEVFYDGPVAGLLEAEIASFGGSGFTPSDIHFQTSGSEVFQFFAAPPYTFPLDVRLTAGWTGTETYQLDFLTITNGSVTPETAYVFAPDTVIPLPMGAALLPTGVVALAWMRRRKA